MNSFFRICIYITIGVIIFNLGMTFFGSLEDASGNPIYGVESPEGTSFDMLQVGTIIGVFTFAGFFASLVFRSLTPIAIGAFAGTYWASFFSASQTIVTVFGLPVELMNIIIVACSFIFFAGVIGMASGSG